MKDNEMFGFGNKDNKELTLVGDFSRAHVYVSGGLNLYSFSQPSESFEKEEHVVTCGNWTYRFINPDKISQEALEDLKNSENTFCFGGELESNLMVNINKGHVTSEPFPDY